MLQHSKRNHWLQCHWQCGEVEETVRMAVQSTVRDEARGHVHLDGGWVGFDCSNVGKIVQQIGFVIQRVDAQTVLAIHDLVLSKVTYQ